MESPNRRSDFTHRRRISHCCICNTALFSTQSKILSAQRLDFTEKSTLSRAFFMLYLPQTVRRGRVFAPKVHQQKPLFVCVAHLLGQVVQTLVVLCLRDRAVFEEGFQGGHLPVVESPSLFLWG